MPEGARDLYDSPQAALAATDVFYRAAAGFSYDLEAVKSWLSKHARIPKAGRVLDLCCGDGIWSKGFKELSPQLELYGIDISAGGIEKARELLGGGPRARSRRTSWSATRRPACPGRKTISI
jgi:SAM-dependent methyltransferase